jgi:hypothetical protein
MASIFISSDMGVIVYHELSSLQNSLGTQRVQSKDVNGFGIRWQTMYSYLVFTQPYPSASKELVLPSTHIFD